MSQPSFDLVDHIAGLQPDSALYGVRHARAKVVAATQGSAEALFDPALEGGLSLQERLLLALYTCQLSGHAALAEHYAERLRELPLPPGWPTGFERIDPRSFPAGRLAELLAFARSVTANPVEGDRQAVERLLESGVASTEVVVAAQLLGFVAYQIRVVAGLAALAKASGTPAGITAATSRPEEPGDDSLIDIEGFTNRTLGWRSWLPVLELDRATDEQIAVLEESHPNAKVSEYYLTLIHQPRILRERSLAFNAIMYAPGGLPRAERELASTVVSRVNQCVYCASVHAQRYTQLAKRAEVIREVFQDPAEAGRTARERAIIDVAVSLTVTPAQFGPQPLEAARLAGLDDTQLLDLIHAVAIFAWANRLMLNLGEPVWPNEPE